jgi:hypothetical protein
MGFIQRGWSSELQAIQAVVLKVTIESRFSNTKSTGYHVLSFAQTPATDYTRYVVCAKDVLSVLNLFEFFRCCVHLQPSTDARFSAEVRTRDRLLFVAHVLLLLPSTSSQAYTN